jgi:DNA-binding NtrC family response regulator
MSTAFNHRTGPSQRNLRAELAPGPEAPTARVFRLSPFIGYLLGGECNRNLRSQCSTSRLRCRETSGATRSWREDGACLRDCSDDNCPRASIPDAPNRLLRPAGSERSELRRSTSSEGGAVTRSQRVQMRITLRVLGRVSQDIIELSHGELLLVGRAPSPDALNIETDKRCRLRCFVVQSPNVSANHFLLDLTDGGLSIKDLRSRNGTWARIPSEAGVLLSGESVALSLGSPQVDPGADPGPEPPPWTAADDYPAAVSLAIEAWLAQRDMRARVRVVPGTQRPGAESLGRLPLATGQDIVVEPTRTMQDDWLDLFGRIERFVSKQNSMFVATEGFREEGLVLASPAMRDTVARVVQAAADGASNLLLLGRSGSGKEGLARCFHRHSRRPGPFVARNCAMFSRELMRSELFGAERGAFTGSTNRIVGAVERAHTGTLFLDELGELPSDLQPMLLRFLDRGEYEPIGRYGVPKFADVSLVCATNRDLRKTAVEGGFRLDLWFRLSVHVVAVPPLHERFEDIICYLRGRKFDDGRTLLDAFEDGALETLRQHSWDGNFRELINFATRAVPLARNRKLTIEQCEELLAEGAISPQRRASAPPTPVRDENPDWSGIWTKAAAAFAEDHGDVMPRSWDDVKDYIESYLKPLMFARLSGTEQLKSRSGLDLKEVSSRVDADRGTAAKQVQRYLDRFVK